MFCKNAFWSFMLYDIPIYFDCRTRKKGGTLNCPTLNKKSVRSHGNRQLYDVREISVNLTHKVHLTFHLVKYLLLVLLTFFNGVDKLG